MVRANDILPKLRELFAIAHDDTIVVYFMCKQSCTIECVDGSIVTIREGDTIRLTNEPRVGQGRGHGDLQRIVNLAGGNPDSNEVTL